MKIPSLPVLAVILPLAACGFKGNLYMPKENDKAKFGPVQTGLDIGHHSESSQKEAAKP